MANGGCNHCKHYEIGKLQMWGEDVPSKCRLGYYDEFKQWWDENGRKKVGDTMTDMECFEETELSILCNKMNGLLDELKALTKE